MIKEKIIPDKKIIVRNIFKSNNEEDLNMRIQNTLTKIVIDKIKHDR